MILPIDSSGIFHESSLDMNNKKEHFQTFSDSRLIEIVRNAKQFGYDDKTRDAALQVLKERDISEEDLRMTGNLSNHKYEYVEGLYKSYNTNSRIAFIAYGTLLIIKGVVIFKLININEDNWLFLIFYLGFFLLYLIAFARSFFDCINFYKAIGKDVGLSEHIIFIFLGMPFYIIMHFIYKRQMKEEMKMVR